MLPWFFDRFEKRQECSFWASLALQTTHPNHRAFAMNNSPRLMSILQVCFSVFLFGLLASSGRGQAPIEEIRVAVFEDKGVGRSVTNLKRGLRGIEGVYYRSVTSTEIRSGVLAEFDLLILPGGSGSKQAYALEEEGRAEIRDYVSGGGGFIGFCAGAYLASADYTWSLNLLDAKVLDRKHWARGKGTVRLGMSQGGQDFFGLEQENVSIHYGQGPLLAPAGNPKIPDYEVLAEYETEIAKNGAPKGIMIGTTAIAAGKFGKGKVLCFSPHPELTDGLESFVQAAIEHVEKQDQHAPSSSFPSQKTSAARMTPDISQRGLPNGNYCAPCAVANLIGAFQCTGEFGVASDLSGQELAMLLGSKEYMQTRERNGTNRYRLVNGFSRFVGQKAKASFTVQYIGVRDYAKKELDDSIRARVTATVGVPTLKALKRELVSKSGVIILFGSYKPNEKNAGRLERVGGHYVAVVGYGVNSAGNEDSTSILLHDSNDRYDGIKYINAGTERSPVELWSEGEILSSNKPLVRLENAPITKDGRVAYLETIFSFSLEDKGEL